MEKITEVDINQLVPHPNNFTMRNITEERYSSLRRKVRRWGQLGAILVDARDQHTILGGHHVYKAMVDEGIKTCKVQYIMPKDDAEALEILIAHNERFAQWVDQGLAEVLQKYKNNIDLSEYKIDLGKMTSAKDILARFGQTEEDEVPPVEPDAISEKGKVYQLGRHRLMCGDSTNPDDVKKLMGGKKISLVVTDPPYGVSYEGNASSDIKWTMIANDDLRGQQLRDFLYKSFKNVADCGVKNMPLYSFYASSTHKEFQDALEMAGYTVRQQIIRKQRLPLDA